MINFTQIKSQIPDNVKLVAVSKTKPEEDILEIYKLGHKIFGENKVQELARKHENLPKDIEWHMIGHLQTNKVKYIAPFVSMIHSVDSFKLLKEINKRAKQSNRLIDCLLEIHIGEEESKFGFTYNKVKKFLELKELKELKNIRIKGLMGMASHTNDKSQIIREFGELKDILENLKTTYFSGNKDFNELSMGMSGDFHEAIKSGSTMVRIGSLIFGNRK